MSLNKETIEKIRNAADIIEVVGDYVSLKKRGQNYIACCPFHDEKTPSFNVSPAKGIYKCFGCGKAGDAIQFVMDVDGVGYVEALKLLAKKYAIEFEDKAPTPEEIVHQSERESLYIILNYAKNYFATLLTETDEGKSIGLSYFKERGFSTETISKFELGYSQDAWEGFLQNATAQQFQLQILEKAGLVIKRENTEGNKSTHYDRFRGRVIFPIHNIAGRVIAFGARILKADKNQPKYINSPETEVYHKSQVLYGIFQAKNKIRSEDNCYLVEGYTDVIAMHQAGVENVVASSGTSLTEDQIKLISKFTKNVTVLYDGDPAGIKASIRGIDMILEAGLNVNVLLFPDGDDPDSYIKKIGAPSFKTYIVEHKQDFITFKTRLFLTDTANDPIKRASVIKEIVESISKIPDAIKRAVLFKQCSQLLEIDEQVLITENNKIQLEKAKSKSLAKSNIEPAKDSPLLDYLTPNEHSLSEIELVKLQERELIRLLLNFGNEIIEGEVRFVDYLLDEVADHDFKDPIYSQMLELVKTQLQEHNELDTSAFITHSQEEIRKETATLLASKYQISTHWERFQIFVASEKDNLYQAVFASIMRLKWRSLKDMIEINMQNLLQPLEDVETKKYQTIHIQLKNAEKDVAAVLGIVIGN